MGLTIRGRAAWGAVAVVCTLALGAPAAAQRAATTKGRQALTYEQAFGGLGVADRDRAGVLADVPTPGEWLDAGHYLETRREDGGRRRTYVVTAADGRIEGVLHIHDLWRTQLF